MKPITDCKQQEQDYRQKISACNVSYRHKRSGPMVGSKCQDFLFSFEYDLKDAFTLIIV